MLIVQKWIVVVFTCVGVFVASSALAAGKNTPAELHDVQNAMLHKVKDALLHRVEAGVFQLKVGHSMDLTENKVLLTFRSLYGFERRPEEKKILITLNGDSELLMPGHRVDLLKHKQSAKSLEGYSTCFLDYVGLITPKGVPATATFRLHCE